LPLSGANLMIEDGSLSTLQNLQHAVIEAGLSPGEAVITHPGDRITSGVRIIERATLPVERHRLQPRHSGGRRGPSGAGENEHRPIAEGRKP
jgi:hypothetical protein